MKRTPTTFGVTLEERELTLIKLGNTSAKANPFGATLEEWELTLIKLGNTSAKANQASGLIIGDAKDCLNYDDV